MAIVVLNDNNVPNKMLDASTTSGEISDSWNVMQWVRGAVQVIGTGATLQHSLDETNWVDFSVGEVGNAIVQLPEYTRYVRAVKSADGAAVTVLINAGMHGI